MPRGGRLAAFALSRALVKALRAPACLFLTSRNFEPKGEARK